jgi:hypothetical protein
MCKPDFHTVTVRYVCMQHDLEHAQNYTKQTSVPGKANLVIKTDKQRTEFNIFQGKLKTGFCYIKFYVRSVQQE